jgi:hypothetical protein
MAISSTGRSRPKGRLHRVEPAAGLGPGAATLVGALAGAPRDGHLALPAGDGERRVSGRAAAGAPAVAHLPEEGDAAEPEVARHLDLAPVLHREGDQAVDLGGCNAGVVERHRDGLTGERQLAVLEPLAEGRLPDADDGGAILEAAARHGERSPV